MKLLELEKYIGLDYEKHNCFDIVRDFYREQFNIELKEYWDGKVVPSDKEIETLIVSSKGKFEQVVTPTFGDIIVIKLKGYACHIGVYLYGDLFLHTIKNTGSCIEPLYKYKRMVEGFYRHKGAAAK